MPRTKRLWRCFSLLASVITVTMLLAGTALAAGPRWSTGWPYYQNNNGNPVVWYTTQPQYFTDPGDLSSFVNHAAADAMVAAAAATWNISTSSLTLSQGGALSEHVSGTNVYLGSSGPVFPSDVQASNYAAKQIAIIYDSDGSVTDTLLGGGASDPINCRQSAVTESVDSISTNGQILHALLILNGRCTGSAAALQQEMKYRLIRAFGRILGLGWSQLNDNVFTGVPQPTSQQSMNWPIMHPIDVLCGPYAYQCMVQPFTLRTDDMASLITLYPVTSAGNGKTASMENAANILGQIVFPNGQGMAGLLVSVRRFHFGPGYTDAFDVTSGVTGASFQQTAGNPITPKDYSLAQSNGSSNQYYEAIYSMGWVPILAGDYFDNFTITTSAVNPLYTGQYAVGPYAVSQVTPSGPALTGTATVVGRGGTAYINLTATSAPATCPAGGDGTVYAPLAVASSGSWSDTLCGYQHSAFSSLPVKANRSLTMEVTATDEQGYATTGKMLPVIGFWDGGDSAQALPTLASQAAPLNASSLGMTNVRVSTATARTMRIAIADLRGDGRPDYGYKARILYADSISPASLPANGGVVTISGMGFHAGNTVTINGIQANVTNWTANTITLVAPPITGPLAADVVVTDLSTSAQSTMSGALTYSQSAIPDVLTVISKPANGGYVGSVGSPVFKVQVMLPDGVTPASSIGVTFSSSGATFGACSGASSCMLTTDPTGFVSSPVTPTSAGTVSLTATVGAASVTSSFVALAIPVDGLTVTSLPSGTVYATLPASAPFSVKVTLPSGAVAAGAGVLVSATNAALAACSGASTCTLTADASGTVSTILTPIAAGVVSLLASAGGGMVSASFGATTLPADALHVVSRPDDGSYVGRTATTPFAVQVMLGDNATPASGAAVTLTATNATLNACGASICVLAANTTGSVTTNVTPSASGTVALTASTGGGMVSTSFSAVVVPPDTLTAVSKPADGSYVGRTATTAFKVQVLLGDTGAAASGVGVIVSTNNGVLNACSAATCTLIADATGTVSTTVTPSSAGSVGLSASAGGGTLSVSFLAAAIPPDSLTLLTKPASGSYVGRPAALPFAVQIFSGETGAPAANTAVTLTAINATLAGCAGTSSCILTADSTGTISTMVTPSAVGTITLSASAGGGTTSTTFTAVAVPPDTLHIVTQPASGSYVGRTAAIPFAVQVALGDTGASAAGASVTVTATNAVLTACGASSCSVIADSTGTISTTVTPSAVGSVSLMAAAGGGTVSTTFSAVAIPPDTLHVVTQPASGSYVGRTAAVSFAVQVALGDTGAPATGVSVVVTATNAVLNACGAATCTLTANASGSISTAVTPSSAGSVSLTASAGGGTVSTTFTAVVVPPDVLHIVTQPANGSYVGRAAATPFTVQVALGDTGAAATGVSVTVSATNALLSACGMSTCTLTADSTGTISTAVTPSAVASVALSASAGGGTASASFTAVAVPPDALHVVTKPADGSYIGHTAVVPFTVQVALGDTGAPASGAAVSVTATNATLNACAAAICTLTADSTGTVSTTLTPTAVGVVALSASAGGGTVTTSFIAAAVPPDTINVVTRPTDGAYVGRVASLPFSVQIVDGATGAPAPGAAVTIVASGANLDACAGASSCVLIADSTGTISTTLTPSAVGMISLSASANGGTAGIFFLAAAVPPDTLTIVTQPASGSYVGRPALLPFAVRVALGDTGAAASGASVIVAAINAVLNACGLATCTLTADATGTISTIVTPSNIGAVSLSASAGGGFVSTTFNAVGVPPDTLHILSRPANGSYAGSPAPILFSVEALLGDTNGPASGAPVTLTATNATLGCGASTCLLPVSIVGIVSTSVTPTAPGTVTLTASAGGGSVSTSFSAAAIPPDSLQIVTVPPDNTYVASPAAIPFSVSVVLGDGITLAAGASVTVSSTAATFAACGLSTCSITANSLGVISTAVTAIATGAITLTASAGGGTVSATFTAISAPDTLQVISAPSDHSLTGQVATTPFVVKATLGFLTNAHLHALAGVNSPDVGQPITLTAVGGKLNACGLPVCILTTDSNGTVSTTVTPLLPGPVTLLAAGTGSSISTIFAADAPPDTLHITSTPGNGSYASRVAMAPFAVQVLLGDGVTPATGASVTLAATGATLGACGLSTCVIMADASGNVSTPVTPSTVGPVQLTASAGGGTTSTSFTSAALPPDTLHVTSQPANGAYAGRTAALPFTVQVLLGNTGGPASGTSATLTATNATLAACGLATCVLSADGAGTVSTTVTPSAPGIVSLTASATGGTTSASFTSAAVPPDTMQVTSHPANGSYAGRIAASPFSVQVLLGDTGAPAIGISVLLSATDGTFGACNSATCTLTTDSSGSVSTTVTPVAAGPVALSAAAGGGSVSTTFTASAIPPDTLHVTSQPANGSYAARVASAPFVVQVLLGDTGAPAAGASVTLSSTNATFSACAAATCLLTADATGIVSTPVTPSTTGLVTLSATAGGGTTAATFTASAVPPDTFHILSQPANSAYVARVASTPFSVQALLGDTGAAAAGANVTLTANGATLGACGLSTCILAADSNGTVSTTVTPFAAGTVQLTASAGGGTISTSFTSAAVPPDTLQVVSHPADGSYVGTPATARFIVQSLLGDTGQPAVGATVTVSASNATLGACSASTCQFIADGTGTISTAVTPIAVGPVNLTATAGGGTVDSTFNAAAAPVDTLRVLSQPAGTVYATVPAATPFSVQVMLPDGRTPASGAAVTVSSMHASLGSCGGISSCILTADTSGTITTSVTPQQAGVVSLQAVAGGGAVTTTFTVATLPANILSIVSSPSGSQYPGVIAANRFVVHVMLGDGVTPAAAAAVALTASGASFGACSATSCSLTADASGNISTTVTPVAPGTATLTASSGGSLVSTTFTVSPDTLRIVSSPANSSYTGSPAATPFVIQVLLGDGTTPVAGASVTVTAAGAVLGACSLTTCTLTADGQGIVSTTATATAPGLATLTATAAGVTTSTSFTAIAPPDVLQVLSTPANGAYVGRQSAEPFTVQVSLGSAANRLPGVSASPNTALPLASGVAVTLSATGATLDACGLVSCTVTTGTLGTVSTTVTPTSAGVVTLSASAAGGTTTASFTAANPPNVLHVISLPATGTYVGRVAGALFAVQVLQGDGVTPAASVSVTLTATGAVLGACGQTTCLLLTDATGMVSTTVTPSLPGTVSLAATSGGGLIAGSFTAVTAPDILHVASTPANGAYTGRAAAQLFSVRVYLGDGVTPASGVSVAITTSDATFGACGLSACTIVADATGTVSTTVSPTMAGTVLLTASAAGGSLSASFSAIDPVRIIAISRTTEYVATGSTVVWTPSVTLLENGLPVSGMAVVWTSQSGLTSPPTPSITDASGTSSQSITIGPLASGSAVSGTVCAWNTICKTFSVQAVDASAWRLITVSGAPQTVSPADTLLPLTVRAVDDAGDWIAGVPMQVNQLVRGWVSCPAVGRCPIGPVLNSGSSTAASDADGLALITPLQASNTPETTGIVVAASPSGYVSVSLSKVP